MKELIFSIYLKTKHLLISFSEFHKIHLMDKVIYKGQIYFVINGTKRDRNGNTLWDIRSKNIGEDGKHECWSVLRTEFKRVLCLTNIRNALFSRYNWWKMYWYNIHLREILK